MGVRMLRGREESECLVVCRSLGDGQRETGRRGKGLLGFGYDPEEEMGILGASQQPYVAKAQYAYFETYDDSPNGPAANIL